ncbi:MAG: hypothetical protein ABI135_01145 [Rhodoferax sp.]
MNAERANLASRHHREAAFLTSFSLRLRPTGRNCPLSESFAFPSQQREEAKSGRKADGNQKASQRVKPVCRGSGLVFDIAELTLANYAHELNAGDQDACQRKP